MRQCLTAMELASELSVAVSTVRAWTRLTDIPRLQVGRLVRFDLDEVVSWLREGGSLASGHRTRETRERSPSSIGQHKTGEPILGSTDDRSQRRVAALGRAAREILAETSAGRPGQKA